MGHDLEDDSSECNRGFSPKRIEETIYRSAVLWVCLIPQTLCTKCLNSYWSRQFDILEFSWLLTNRMFCRHIGYISPLKKIWNFIYYNIRNNWGFVKGLAREIFSLPKSLFLLNLGGNDVSHCFYWSYVYYPFKAVSCCLYWGYAGFLGKRKIFPFAYR